VKKVSAKTKIVNYINKHGPQTSNDLKVALNLPASRVYNEIYKLVKAGLAKKDFDKRIVLANSMLNTLERPKARLEQSRDTSYAENARTAFYTGIKLGELEKQVSEYSDKYMRASAVLEWLESRIDIVVKAPD
jgi:hypothetical protein